MDRMKKLVCFLFTIIICSLFLAHADEVNQYTDKEGVIHYEIKGSPAPQKQSNISSPILPSPKQSQEEQEKNENENKIDQWNSGYERVTTLSLNLEKVKTFSDSELLNTITQLGNLAESLSPLKIDANKKLKKLRVIQGCLNILGAEIEIRKEEKKLHRR